MAIVGDSSGVGVCKQRGCSDGVGLDVEQVIGVACSKKVVVHHYVSDISDRDVYAEESSNLNPDEKGPGTASGTFRVV